MLETNIPTLNVLPHRGDHHIDHLLCFGLADCTVPQCGYKISMSRVGVGRVRNVGINGMCSIGGVLEVGLGGTCGLGLAAVEVDGLNKIDVVEAIPINPSVAVIVTR